MEGSRRHREASREARIPGPGRGLVLALVLGLCAAGAAEAERLTAAVAQNLRSAFDEAIARLKEREPDLELSAVYGSTGALHAQIRNGAPFDLFLSADVKTPGKLAAEGLARGEAFVYARGSLALWVPAASPLDVEKLGIQAVLDPTVRFVASANPRHAPYGAAAVAALEHFGLTGRVGPRMVPGNDIAQSAQFVQMGSCQIGFVAMAQVLGPELRGKGRHWKVPQEAFPPIDQAGVVLARTRVPEAAERVRAWLLGPEFGAVLEGYGYTVPEVTR